MAHAPAAAAWPKAAHGLSVQVPAPAAVVSQFAPTAMDVPASGGAVAVQVSISPPPIKASEGVDGLLLLSACADVQRQDSVENAPQYQETLPQPPCYPSPAASSTCCSHSSSSMIMA